MDAKAKKTETLKAETLILSNPLDKFSSNVN